MSLKSATTMLRTHRLLTSENSAMQGNPLLSKITG